ncbi:MAG: RNA polymerase factor sigma-54 [Phycisphaerales bacterium]|nr:RNA polymerase factor sigma-54 [Phycisphaerales bacterium]
MRLEQKLTPQLIQSMNILQLNALALENHVAEELEKNYALEVEEHHPTDPDANRPREDRSDGNGEVESFERLERLAREYSGEDFFSSARRRVGGSEERDAKMDAMANAASRPESLAEHLVAQWSVIELSDDVRRAGEAIIYSLEDDGYLRVQCADIAADAHPPLDVAVVEQALAQVQQLDPVGVAARDYQECLLLQLEALPGDNRIEKVLVRDHLTDVVKNRYPAIAKATGYSIGEITEAVKAMQSTLYLHPGYTVVDREVAPILPDVIVEEADSGGGFEVRLTRSSSPRLRISPSVLEMLKSKGAEKDVRDFVRSHVESATALMDAIKFRKERLRLVAERIVEHQREFFDTGPEGLQVLRMSDLAEELECDPSTISRTVAGKYVQTPRGIFPMRYFFTGGTTTSDGETTSWDSVKAAVERIVAEEDKKKPLNDDQIAAMLSEKGTKISRRTIAKYRQQLDIPSARQRREY